MNSRWNKNEREGKTFKNSTTFQTCEGGGNNNTKLPPETMSGDGDDRLRFITSYDLRGSIEVDGEVIHQLGSLWDNPPNYLTIRDVGAHTVGFISVRAALN